MEGRKGMGERDGISVPFFLPSFRMILSREVYGNVTPNHRLAKRDFLSP